MYHNIKINIKLNNRIKISNKNNKTIKTINLTSIIVIPTNSYHLIKNKSILYI